MPVVDLNGARLWYDESGSGPAVLLLHGGLGDSGLWEPVVPFLAERFRTIRTDLRFFGRSIGPAGAVVVARRRDRSARRARHRARGARRPLARRQARARHRARASRAALGASSASRRGSAATTATRTPRSTRRATTRPRTRTEAMLEIDLEVWAPLGADERIRELWHATPDANPLPDGVEPLEPPGAPAKERLGELAVPDARRDGRARPRRLPRDRPARGGRGAERAPRRARLRPLRDATRAGARRRRLLARLPSGKQRPPDRKARGCRARRS